MTEYAIMVEPLWDVDIADIFRPVAARGGEDFVTFNKGAPSAI